MFRKWTSGWSNALKANHWYLPALSCPTRRAARPASSLRTLKFFQPFSRHLRQAEYPERMEGQFCGKICPYSNLKSSDVVIGATCSGQSDL
jgi:hypothetical protein